VAAVVTTTVTRLPRAKGDVMVPLGESAENTGTGYVDDVYRAVGARRPVQPTCRSSCSPVAKAE
jgi:hypothetical protein